MERFELEPALKEEIRARVLGEGFMKIVQTVRRNGKVFRISMRPVEIGGERKFQAEMTDDGQVQVKNLSANAAAEGLEEIIAQRGLTTEQARRLLDRPEETQACGKRRAVRRAAEEAQRLSDALNAQGIPACASMHAQGQGLCIQILLKNERLS